MLRRPFGSWTNRYSDMTRLQREMDRLFAEMSTAPARQAAPRYPAMNVWTNENIATLTAELPGCNPDNLSISIVNDTLTLSGTRQPEPVDESATYHRRERSCGSFTRTFQLPFQVAVDKVEAAFENGVLQITLPRAEADKPKKIAIKAG
jgi:HSP20 family protein